MEAYEVLADEMQKKLIEANNAGLQALFVLRDCDAQKTTVSLAVDSETLPLMVFIALKDFALKAGDTELEYVRLVGEYLNSFGGAPAHTLNDRGELVPAVGEPGSIERVRCEWPSLIYMIVNAVLQSRAEAEQLRIDNQWIAIKYILFAHRIPKSQWPVFLKAAGATQEEIVKVMGVENV